MHIDPIKTIFLIDGSSFLYRAYYGLRPLHTRQGEPVQAVYGFCRMLKKLLNKFHPHYMALVWDSKGQTTRHTIFQEYKATRQAPPSDLFQQKIYIEQFAQLIGLKQITQSGIEADDIMFSLAQDWLNQSGHVVLITSDKDMGQLLQENAVMYDPLKDIIIDRIYFEEKYGFAPEKLPFYYALVGDTSDNIPGVKGIGKKGATELVQQFASLECMYQSIDTISSKRIQQTLRDHKEDAFLSHRLFLLQYIPLGMNRDEYLFSQENWSNARPLFEELDFKSFLQEIDPSTPTIKESTKNLHEKNNFICVTTQQQLDELVDILYEKKTFALDTETDGLRPLQSQLIGFSVCTQEGTAYYVPLAHQTDEPQLSATDVLQKFRPLFEQEMYKKCLHNAKYDWLVFQQAGIQLRGIVFDTIIAARLLVHDWQRIGLKQLSDVLFNESMFTYQDIVTDNKYKNFSFVPLKLATIYAAADAHQTFKLWQLWRTKIDSSNLHKLFYDIEMPCMHILCEMEKQGIYINTEKLYKVEVRVAQEIDALEDIIFSLLGKEKDTLNLNSPKQIEHLLFTELQLPPQKKRGKEGYSTDHEVLRILAEHHPIPKLLLQHRELSKLKNTYLEALPKYVNPQTGKIHTSYSQTAVATGRLSSYDPNLQNIPTNSSGHGLEIRATFQADTGYSLISADYSQIELRVLAHFSQDAALTHAFLQNHDIHTQTAARLFDQQPAMVTSAQRQIGKRINFSILYGLTPFGLSKDLYISLKEAKTYIDKYFAQYPGVLQWMESVITHAKEHGYVETLAGRKRHVPAIHEKNVKLFQEAKRIAINSVAQGTAADIMKMGMIAVNKFFQENQMNSHILLQIHDELILQVPTEQIHDIEPKIRSLLESVVHWNVPLTVSTRHGQNWKDITK